MLLPSLAVSCSVRLPSLECSRQISSLVMCCCSSNCLSFARPTLMWRIRQCCSGYDPPVKSVLQSIRQSSRSYAERELSDFPCSTSSCLLFSWLSSLDQSLLVRISPTFITGCFLTYFLLSESVLINMTKSVNIMPSLGLMQPPDNYYNNTDTFYWDANPLEVDDGAKELKAGASQNQNANAKFKFLF